MNLNITASYTDLYQVAMGQAYFLEGRKDMTACFDYFFRKVPNNGGYVIFAGLDDVLEILESIRFTAENIEYLTSQGFDKNYLNYLRDFRFSGNIYSPREGDVVFPTEPILRVEGSIIEAQLIETLILNMLNFQSLIATKAARIRSVAEGGLLSDFGLRRSHGPGGIFASRAAVIGGFHSTSNVAAAELYGLKAAGTMAHSFIQLHEDELTAFRKFAEARPDDSVFLVDTYNTLKSGVPNAIKVAKEMEERGHRLRAIRLDSGDLAFLAKKSRKMLDEAGLDYVKIAASNQLDEYVVRSLRHQKAPIDIFGVGTNLVTGKPDAALDGVYKLAEAGGEPRIKISENLKKVTLPGKKQVWRLYNNDGSFYGADAVGSANEDPPEKLIHPFEEHKSLNRSGMEAKPQMEQVMKNGERSKQKESVDKIREYSLDRLSLLPDEFKRFENPHIYKIGISENLRQTRNELRRKFAPEKSNT